MSYFWKKQGITIQHFGPDEFDHPDLMDGGFLSEMDTVRMRCGFPIKINDDARTREDLERIYAKEIARGQHYPTDSAHVYDEEDDVLVRSVDWEPALPADGDGSDLTLEERELDMDYQILRMWKEGVWKHIGVGYETGHNHTDDTPRLGARRPARWVAVSR